MCDIIATPNSILWRKIKTISHGYALLNPGDVLPCWIWKNKEYQVNLNKELFKQWMLELMDAKKYEEKTIEISAKVFRVIQQTTFHWSKWTQKHSQTTVWNSWASTENWFSRRKIKKKQVENWWLARNWKWQTLLSLNSSKILTVSKIKGYKPRPTIPLIFKLIFTRNYYSYIQYLYI